MTPETKKAILDAGDLSIKIIKLIEEEEGATSRVMTALVFVIAAVLNDVERSKKKELLDCFLDAINESILETEAL